MATQTHNDKLNQKRAERKRKDVEDSPSEKREVVMHGAKLRCEYAQQLGELKVTSNELQLQDKLWATEGDGNNMVNLQFKGTCGHPKWPAKNMPPPPCMSVIKLSPWEKLGDAIVQDQKVLVKESTITCNPDFNSATASPIPKVESIKYESVDEYAVKAVKLISTLDQGSKNDKSRTEQPGMVFGKTYEFKVAEYKNGKKPEQLSVIKWMYRYFSQSKNIWIEKALKVKGETLKLTMTDKEMCGRFVYVRAYIKDPKCEGELKVWKHNMFRWFDGKQLEDEIIERKNKPYLANQKNTSLCGMAAVMYLLAKQNHSLYQKFILDLHRKGFFKFDNYTVDVTKKSKHLLKMNPITNTSYPEDYEGKMPYCDWISFASIRDQENNLRDFDGEEDFSFDGATFPNEIKKLMKGVLGYSEIVDNTNMVFNKGTLVWDGENSSSREIAKMRELTEKGYAVVMLVNTNMIKIDEVVFYKDKKRYKIKEKPAKKSGLFGTIEHWIVFDEIIGGTISWDEYDIKVFTWGQMKDIIVSPEIFSTNYYGYVYGK